MNARDRRKAKRMEERRHAPVTKKPPRCPDCGRPAMKYHSEALGFICPKGHAFQAGDAA